MRYLVIDASLNGTGIRDYYEGGYVEPSELGLNSGLIKQIKTWLLNYADEKFNGFKNHDLINELDQEGIEIAYRIKNELSDIKISYFSDAKLAKIDL